MRATPGNCVMAFAGAAGTVCRDAADLLIPGKLVRSGRPPHRFDITDVASRDPDAADLQCLPADAVMDFAPVEPGFRHRFEGRGEGRSGPPCLRAFHPRP